MTYKSKKAADKIARLHIVHTLKRYSTHSIAYNARFCKGVLKIRMRFLHFLQKIPDRLVYARLGKDFREFVLPNFPEIIFPLVIDVQNEISALFDKPDGAFQRARFFHRHAADLDAAPEGRF